MRMAHLVLVAGALLVLPCCGLEPDAAVPDGRPPGETGAAAEAASDAEIAEGMNLEAEIVGRIWALASLDGQAPVEGSASTMMLEEDGKISGLGGCNRYFGTYTLQGDALEVGPLAATRMACPPPLAQHESRFTEVLEGTRFLRLDGSQLTLTGDEGELVFVLDEPESPAGDELPSDPL